MEDVLDLQEDLNVVCRWSYENNMQLHEHKFQLISHRCAPSSVFDEMPFFLEQCSYKVSNDITLFPSADLRDLGVAVSSDLSWSTHISIITSKARSMASWVLSVFRCRERDVMFTLYKSLIRSHLEFCCPLRHPAKIKDVQDVESVQRVFTKKISGMESLSYWTRLKRLGIMSLQRRRERFIILQMFNIRNGLNPN